MTLPFHPALAAAERDRATRALLLWTARDGLLLPRTGQAVTFARASSGTAWDSGGRLVTVPHSQARLEVVLNSATGLSEAALLVEPTRTNLCLQSDNFGLTWVAVGTPTRVAAAKTAGDLSLDLLGDDDGVALEGYQQAITFTGDAIKAVHLCLAAGSSTSTVIRLRDTTAAADRLLATITWAAGVPTVTMSTGVQIGSPVARANGVYDLQFQTPTVTAINAHQIQVYPATTAALGGGETGTVHVGGVGVYNAPFPGSVIRTTTAAVTRAADQFSLGVLWPLGDAETWYARCLRPRWADLAGDFGTGLDLGLLGRVGPGGVAPPRQKVWLARSSRDIVGQLWDGATVGQTSLPMSTGPVIEVALQARDLLTGGRLALDVGAGFTAFTTPVSAFSSLHTVLAVGQTPDTTAEQLGGGLTHVAIASGLRTMTQMRGLAGA